jgi:hypothetical protein
MDRTLATGPSHPVSTRCVLISFSHHTCISQVVYFREVWQPKFCVHLSFPVFIRFARFHLFSNVTFESTLFTVVKHRHVYRGGNVDPLQQK